MSVNPDGSDLKTIAEEGRKLPDGLAVDVAAGHIYWTNMGNPKANDGSILRSDLDGRKMTTIVPPGGTFTPKQLQIEKSTTKLYWCDREGMRVMRASLDGSNIETRVDTSGGDHRPGPDARKWCVGIAVDIDRGKVYWTQKGGTKAGQGRICRANIERVTTDRSTGAIIPNRVMIEWPAQSVSMKLMLSSIEVNTIDKPVAARLFQPTGLEAYDSFDLARNVVDTPASGRRATITLPPRR